MTENYKISKSKMNLRCLRLSLKYRPELYKLILKMRQSIRKRNTLLKSLKHRLKILDLNAASSFTEKDETLTDETKKFKDSTTQTTENFIQETTKSDVPDVPKEVTGWNLKENGDTEKSIAEQVKEAAQSALQDTGMVYVESAGMYYDYKTGYYYNSELGLYYHTDTGCYYHYSDDKQFVFHSYPDMSKVNASLIAHQKKKARKLKRGKEEDGGKPKKARRTKSKKDKKEKRKEKDRKGKKNKRKRNAEDILRGKDKVIDTEEKLCLQDDKTKTKVELEKIDDKMILEDHKKLVLVDEKEVTNDKMKDSDEKIMDDISKGSDDIIEEIEVKLKVVEDKESENQMNEIELANCKDTSTTDQDAKIEEIDTSSDTEKQSDLSRNNDKEPDEMDTFKCKSDSQVKTEDNQSELKNIDNINDSHVKEDSQNENLDEIELILDSEMKNQNSEDEKEEEELEDGECSETDSEDSSSESDASTATDSDEDSVAKHHPPCMRVIVRETTLSKLKVGSLFLITKDGGTIGREGDKHAILLRDHNVSRNHLDIRYDVARKIYTATDQGSKNGTILNGVKMSESQEISGAMDVLHGSTIQLGETKLLCHIHPGHATCGQCEPGLLMQVEEEKKAAYTRTVSVKKQHELELARLKNIYAPQRLAIEEKGNTYKDRAQARREAVGSTNHAEKTQSTDLDTTIAADNKGFKLLQKMGWSEGEGLGKDSQGGTEPVPLISNEGKAGLGTTGAVAPPSNTPRPRVNHIAAATLRLATRTKMLQPPAKAFQEEDEDEED